MANYRGRKPRRTVGYRPYVSPYTKSSSVSRSHIRYYANQAPLSTQPAQAVSTYTYSRSKTGNYLRNWKAVIRANGNATTKLDAWEHTVERNYPQLKVYNWWRVNQFNPWIQVRSEDNFVNFLHVDLAPFSSHFISTVAQKAQDQAAAALIRRINSAHHQLQGGVILGEIDKTARLLTNTARNLKQGVLQYIGQAVGIRKGKGTKGSKQKAIANSYLEATFGWQPLIHDAKDFAKTLGRLTFEADKVRFKAVGEWEEQYSQTATEHSNAGLVIQKNVLKTTSSKVVYKGFLRGLPYEAGSPPLERIISMSGFDLRSFVPTMWELIPYSFIVDYFTNIGDCLQSWTLDTSVVKSLWRTQITESTVEIRCKADVAKSIANISSNNGTNGKDYTGFGQDGRSVMTYRTIARDVAAVPLLVPQLTGLDLPWKQFANLGALITAKMR